MFAFVTALAVITMIGPGLSGSVASASQNRTRTLFVSQYPSSGGCLGDGILAGTANFSAFVFVPLKQANQCLQNISIAKDIALQNVYAYDELFDLSYAFYGVARNPADTMPRDIPSTWSVYEGAKVNLKQKTLDLAADIEANGGADGLLPLKLKSLYGEARDLHTDLGIMMPYVGANGNPFEVALIDTALFQNGSSSEPFYLSLSRGGDDKVHVVYKYDDEEGNIVRERRIESINGEDGVLALSQLTSNIGLGGDLNAKSEGARMNAFLSNAWTDNSVPGVLWSTFIDGDISQLPQCLNVTFDDGQETQWCFHVMVSDPKSFSKTSNQYSVAFSTPQATYKKYKALLTAINDASPWLQISDGYNFDTVVQEGTKINKRSLKAQVKDVDTPIDGKTNNFTLWKARPVPKGDKMDGLLGGYQLLDDGVVVMRYPQFSDAFDDTAELWKNTVQFARDNNATKLILDMIGNGGGSVETQYLMRLALYPEMEYDDWADWYTQRISDKMDRILKYIESSNVAKSVILENKDSVLKAFASNPNFTVQFFDSVVANHRAYLNFTGGSNELGPVKNNLVEVNKDLNTALRVLATATASIKKGTAGLSSESVNEVLYALLRVLETPNTIYAAQLENGRQTLFQGGSEVNTTGFYHLVSTVQDFLNAKQKVIPNLPFESYILLDNGLSGSSASSFEQGLRAYAKKYAGKVTPLKAVSFGCLGTADTCPLTQFSGGSTGGGNGQLYAVYLAGPGLFALDQMIYFLNETKALPKADQTQLNNFAGKFDTEYLQQVPSPASMQMGGLQYAYHAIYPHIVPTNMNVIPMEYLNQPADGYISMWPKPGTFEAGVSEGQQSLPALYGEASKMFETRENASNTPPLPGNSSPSSGSARCCVKHALTLVAAAALFF